MERFNSSCLLPQLLASEYEARLKGVLRWQDANVIFPVKNPHIETDKDHIEDGFLMIDEIQKAIPELSLRINFGLVRKMWYVHDAGEIVVGDISHASKDSPEEVRKHKRRESLAFTLILSPKIPGDKERGEAKELYLRNERREPSDLEAQLVQMVDKGQGNRKGIEYYFSYQPFEEPTPEMIAHIQGSIDRFMVPVRNLVTYLPINLANNIRLYAQTELRNFDTIGYGKYIQDALNELSLYLVS